MTWPILIELSKVFSSFDRWLHDLEPPELSALPVSARALLYFLVLSIILSTLRDALKIVTWGAHKVFIFLLDVMAERVFFDSLEPIAMIYVRLESLMLRLRVFHFRNEMLQGQPSSRVMFPELSSSPRPVGSTTLDYFRATLSMLTIVVAMLVTAPISLLKWIFRPTRIKIIAAVLALWYVGTLAPAIKFLSTIRLGDIQLSVVVAAGTLIAVVYAAANSDVRGRAELNKTASLECRTAMHGCTQPLLSIANNLRRIRKLSANSLLEFPTEKDIEEVTARKDLEWRGSRLLPRGAEILPHQLRGNGMLRFHLIEVALTYWFSRTGSVSSLESPLIAERSVRQHLDQVKKSHETIAGNISKLRDAGFIGKLDRVLDPASRGILVALYYDDFGLSDAELLVKAGNDGWLSKVTERESERELIVTNWKGLRDEPSDSIRMWYECEVLSDLLRRFIRKEYEDQWGTVITEYRLIYLAQNIDKTLRPRLVERVRQAFGK